MITMKDWTWGQIKRGIDAFVDDDEVIWYIDINQEKSERTIEIRKGEKRGVEMTNHPDI